MDRIEEECWWALTEDYDPHMDEMSSTTVHVLARVYVSGFRNGKALVELGGLGGEMKEVPEKQLRPHAQAGWVTVTEPTEEKIRLAAMEKAGDRNA